MPEHFWTRWSREYLSSLQRRSKWKGNVTSELNQGELVMLNEDNTPPLNWKISWVTWMFPREDKVVRVVNVKTVNGEVRRAVKNLCLLPIDPS